MAYVIDNEHCISLYFFCFEFLKSIFRKQSSGFHYETCVYMCVCVCIWSFEVASAGGLSCSTCVLGNLQGCYARTGRALSHHCFSGLFKISIASPRQPIELWGLNVCWAYSVPPISFSVSPPSHLIYLWSSESLLFFFSLEQSTFFSHYDSLFYWLIKGESLWRFLLKVLTLLKYIYIFHDWFLSFWMSSPVALMSLMSFLFLDILIVCGL